MQSGLLGNVWLYKSEFQLQELILFYFQLRTQKPQSENMPLPTNSLLHDCIADSKLF